MLPFESFPMFLGKFCLVLSQSTMPQGSKGRCFFAGSFGMMAVMPAVHDDNVLGRRSDWALTKRNTFLLPIIVENKIPNIDPCVDPNREDLSPTFDAPATCGVFDG